MKKYVFVLAFVVVTAVVVFLAFSRPALDYTLKPLPSFEVKAPASAFNIVSSGGRLVVADNDAGRIAVYGNGVLDRVVVDPKMSGVEQLHENTVGSARSLVKVGDKVYLATTNRHLFVFDIENNEYSFLPNYEAESIAESSSEKDVYMFTFGKKLLKVSAGAVAVFKGVIPYKISDMRVRGGYIYALDSAQSRIVRIDFSGGTVEDFYSLPAPFHIVSYDIEDMLYVVAYDYGKNKTVLMAVDIGTKERVKQAYFDAGIELGSADFDNGVLVVSSSSEGVVYYFKDFELQDSVALSAINRTNDFFELRSVAPLGKGLVLSDSYNNRLLHIECSSYDDCRIVNSVSTYRPVQVSVYGGLVCSASYWNGVECFDRNLSRVKELHYFDGLFLKEPKGVFVDSEGLFVSDTASGCVFKFSSGFEPVAKSCGLVEPRFISKVNGFLAVGESYTESVVFFNETSMNMVKMVPLHHTTILRGIAPAEGDYIYAAFYDEGLFRERVFLNGSILPESVESAVVVPSHDAHDVYNDGGRLYFVEEKKGAVHVIEGNETAVITASSVKNFGK